MGQWVEIYNHVRPHGQMGMLTPAQVRRTGTLHQKAA
ncbi:MAG: integrase core domain-containing protein [Proteobacteria bacterium]|nr:integrase core domain-containing protein [Pseudomonadota bacterium]